jgi:hypothetical protein
VLTDITPTQGGGIQLRSISTKKISPSVIYCLPGSSGKIDVNLNSGSSWTLLDSGYSGINNINQSKYNYKKLYWLDNNGVYYSSNGLSTAKEIKTGNWQTVYGLSFSDSGKKIAIIPRPVS